MTRSGRPVRVVPLVIGSIVLLLGLAALVGVILYTSGVWQPLTLVK